MEPHLEQFLIGVWTVLKSEQAPTERCERVGAKRHEQPPRDLALCTRELVPNARNAEWDGVDSDPEQDDTVGRRWRKVRTTGRSWTTMSDSRRGMGRTAKKARR